MKLKQAMRECLIGILLLICLKQIQAKAMKPGATFEIECPFKGIKNINNIRTYAIVLNNGHKNVEVNVSEVNNDNKFMKQENLERDDNFTDKQVFQENKCYLNKDNKVCLFDGFINEILFKCDSVGSVSLMIVQPVLVAEILEDQPLRVNALAPILKQNETGVLIFRPDGDFELGFVELQELFLSNCIQVIEYFQHQVLLGIRGRKGIQIIMVGEELTGEWTFKKVNNVFEDDLHPIEAYNSPGREMPFYVGSYFTNVASPTNNDEYHAVNILLRSQNLNLLQKIELNFIFVLKINEHLISQQESLNRTLKLLPGDLRGEPPLKLSFFFSQHPIQQIVINSTLPIHYLITLSGLKIEKEGEIKDPPIIEQNEYLFYFYEKLKSQKLLVQAHIQKYFKNKTTPTLNIFSQGAKSVDGFYEDTELLNQGKVDAGIKKLQIVNNQISPAVINDDASYAVFNLQVEPSEIELAQVKNLKRYKMKNRFESLFFKLILETSYIPTKITIGMQVSQFLFENEIKKFIIAKQQIGRIKSQKLIVKCSQCLAYFTYEQSCNKINCCKQIQLEQIDVKNADLLLIIKSQIIHTSQTSLVKLKVIQDSKAYTLQGGNIIQSVLQSTHTYIYETDGRFNIQLICSTQTQTILLLVNVHKNEFPAKSSFDFQSNEGFISIPALKVPTTVYIKVLKMISTSYENYKVPYSLVIFDENQKVKLIQGQPVTHIFPKLSKKRYVFRYGYISEKNLFIRFNIKDYHSSMKKSSIDREQKKNELMKITIYFEGQVMLVRLLGGQLSEQLIIDVSKEMELNFELKFDDGIIYEIQILVQNLIQSSYSLYLIYFQEKQKYQIFSGQFVTDHLMSNNPIFLYCMIDPKLDTNIYAYSVQGDITIKVDTIGVDNLNSIGRVIDEIHNQNNKFKGGSYANFNRQLMPSHSQYIHIASRPAFEKTQNMTLVIISVLGKDSSLKDVHLICTQDKTTIGIGQRLQYKLGIEQSHTFYYSVLSDLLNHQQNKNIRVSDGDREIVLQTSLFDGGYSAKVSLTYEGEKIGEFEVEGQKDGNDGKSQGQHEPILIIKLDEIRQKLKKKSISDISNLAPNSLFIQFTLTCHKQSHTPCIFLTSLQSSESSIRQLSAGIPQMFHMNKHSSIIFMYNNKIKDSEFKFKVNRKLGFPNYKLCSYRSAPSIHYFQFPDKCYSELQIESSEDLLIEDNSFGGDSKTIVGRTHQLIINQFNEQYCTNCTYYLALYSGYDVVEGSVFVMSATQPTYLQEGDSITTIVYRGRPDEYTLLSWESLMGIVYEIEGKVEVKVFEIGNDGNRVVLDIKQSQKDLSNKDIYHKSVITINLLPKQNPFPSFNITKSLTNTQQNSLSKVQEKNYLVSISPLNNSPSALYTLIIISKQVHVINLKDGVPYEMKYTVLDEQESPLNPIIRYKYRCENDGIIMINTKNFQDLDIIVRCEDEIENQLHSYSNQGRVIDITKLLQALYGTKLSSRLDLPISPKECLKYEIMVTAKMPTVSYTVLVSSIDIITLPLHKEIPGILKYQVKLFQIYEISIHEKAEIRTTFKFCQGGDGRIMIAKSKKDIYQEFYEQEIEISESTTYYTMKYSAKPGFFYIKVQFKSRGGTLEYTIHAQNINNNDGVDSMGNTVMSNQLVTAPPLRIFSDNIIQYRVTKISSRETQFQISFNEIILQTDSDYQIQYYVVESSKLKLLKKTENCNGQYFVEFVNHHQKIKETKINFTRKGDERSKVNKQNEQKESDEKDDREIKSGDMERFDWTDDMSDSDDVGSKNNKFFQESGNHRISFKYSTETPYTFITIVPIIYKKKTHEFYHLYIPKYHEVQLKNGQLFSGLTNVVSEILSKIQNVIDIHGSEDLILLILGILGITCVGGLLIFGVWVGARFFKSTRIIYVPTQIRQEENDGEEEQDNTVVEVSSTSVVVENKEDIERAQESIQKKSEFEQLQESCGNLNEIKVELKERDEKSLDNNEEMAGGLDDKIKNI